MQSYLLATQYDKEWYKAWHAWALANFEVISFFEKSNSTENNTPADQNITVTEEVNGDIHQEVLRYVVPSVQGINNCSNQAFL